MTILALLLDPSYENTGYAIVNEKGQALYTGSFQCVNVHAPQRVRAHEIAYRVGQFASTFPITHIGMEEPVYHGKRNACKSLDRLNGAIGQALYPRFPNVPIYDMEVKEWRDALEFTAPTKKKTDPEAVVKARLKAALLHLAQMLFPGVPFATVDAAEAALLGARLLLHLSGTRPFAPRAKKWKTKGTVSSTSSPTSSETSGSAASSPTRHSSKRLAIKSTSTAKTSPSSGS